MKKTGLFTLMATAIVGAVIAKNSTLLASSPIASEVTSHATVVQNVPTPTNEGEIDSDPIVEAIITRSDVPVTFANDETYPWTIDGTSIKNGNCGVKNSTSIIKLTYKSSYKTELSFDWRCYNYSSHDALRLYVDGISKGSTTSYDYVNKRIYIEPGEHIIMLRDSIGNSTNTNNWSYIKNLAIKEIKPLESAALSDKSSPLSFTNNGNWPWTIEDGYIQNTNYGTAYSASEFSTSFSVDKLSKFSFQQWVNRYDEYTGSASTYHTFRFYINGTSYNGQYYTSGWQNVSVALEPGDYTVTFRDTIYNTTTAYYSRVKNIELSSNWVDVELATAGSLGVEVLYQVNVLNDVELLKVKGTLNSTDWTTIKNMHNILALDLSEAKFDAVPNNAFDGLSRLSNVKLPDGVKTIGEYAFRGTQILNIDIPSSVTSIGQYAFYQTRVRSVNFKDDSELKTIGYQAFYECTSLNKFIMPNTVTKLGTYNNNVDYSCNVFYGCTSLKEVHFSDALTTLEQSVCSGCTNLVTVHLPNNLRYIRNNAFYNTSKLHHIDLPESLYQIDNSAFYQSALDSIVLPLRLAVLESYAFQNCDNLKYIELPSYIGSYDRNFYDCSNVEKVVCQSATPPAISTDPFQNARAKSAITLVVPSFAVVNYKLDTYWYQFGSIVEGDDIDYWKITSALSLTNNRRMNGKPDIDLYYGGQLTVGGNAPMETGNLNFYVSEGNPGRLLSDCNAFTADSINSYFSVESGKWYFFTPLHDVDMMKVTHSANASFVFRYYDGESRATNGTGNSWRNVDTGKLLAGQGYIFHCNAAGTVSMPAEATGHLQVLNTSDVTKSLNAYEATASANKSWNYVGNPYPSYYDIYYMDFTAPITVWTGSTYKAYSIVDDNLVLRPMQSFFVQKPDEVDNIIFHKEGRQLTSSIERPSYAKAMAKAVSASSRHFFNLQITNDDEVVDETRVVVNEEAELSYEINSDASKFMSMENGVPQIFTLDSENNSYAINERPLSDGNVKVGYRAAASGFYTISAIRADGDATLYDNKMNKSIDLTSQDYTFYSEATESVDNSRFVLKLGISTSPTGIDEAQTSTISVAGANGNITISGANGCSVIVYTTDGRKVYNGVANNTNMNISVPNGTYIVKVNNSTFKTAVF